MKLYLKGHDYEYAATQMLLALMPENKPVLVQKAPQKAEDGAVSALFRGEKIYTGTCRLTLDGKTVTASTRAAAPGTHADKDTRVRLEQRLIKQSVFKAYCALTGNTPPWGALSGVRPTKLVTRHILSENGTAKSADKMMRTMYSVTPKRSRLCVEAGMHTVEAARSLKEDEISLYIGIPFCPTRCTYCSFVSHSIERSANLLEPFLEALHRELEVTAKLISDSGKKIRTIYIGGGTPTTLNAAQLKSLIEKTKTVFDLSRLTEYTVEAGRPDTIDAEKLKTLKDLGVSRISVNPQTMRDDVLKLMGRNHTCAQTETAMELALAQGFEAVNADMIAGLPGDDYRGFCDSLEKIIAYGPENITVHTLSIKRGSELNANGGTIPSGEEVGRMLDFAEDALRNAGYEPYYLYRQKYMSGSFENVGWTKPGHDNLYNICMMEELHTVISCGGAGSTKVIGSDGKLVRQTNPKYPKEYITNIDKILDDKKKINLKG